MTDEDYMQTALELAEKGAGYTSPNPMVGAVIVKGNRIIGQGWHKKYGGLHAERNALANCCESPMGAVMYVTLEPCCHYGKTPPCTEAVISSGIKRVVIGSRDPNPLVAGKGVEMLEQKGIEVMTGVLQESCDRLNRIFFHYIRTGLPYVIMKYAMTMDGKIAAYTGESKWITGSAARKRVHEDRHRYAGIMVGVGTVLADDPMLNCRLENGKNPVRIICDSGLRTPERAQVVMTANEIPTIIATCCTDRKRQNRYRQAGCRIVQLPEQAGRVDLKRFMQELGRNQIDSILLEGGSELNWSALKSGIVHRVQAYIAPKLLGGTGAKSPVGGQGFEMPARAVHLKAPELIRLGDDILMESEVIPCLPE